MPRFFLEAAIFMASALAACPAIAQAGGSNPRQDAMLTSYFDIWEHNAAVTPATVARLYARSVAYYGQQMSRDAVFRDKASYIRRWPNRTYAVEPRSAQQTCNADRSLCSVRAVLLWQAAGPGDGRAMRGASRISLTLVRQDGDLKIAREAAVTLRR